MANKTLSMLLPDDADRINSAVGIILNGGANFVWAHRNGDMEMAEDSAKWIAKAANLYIEYIEKYKKTQEGA